MEFDNSIENQIINIFNYQNFGDYKILYNNKIHSISNDNEVTITYSRNCNKHQDLIINGRLINENNREYVIISRKEIDKITNKLKDIKGANITEKIANFKTCCINLKKRKDFNKDEDINQPPIKKKKLKKDNSTNNSPNNSPNDNTKDNTDDNTKDNTDDSTNDSISGKEKYQFYRITTENTIKTVFCNHKPISIQFSSSLNLVFILLEDNNGDSYISIRDINFIEKQKIENIPCKGTSIGIYSNTILVAGYKKEDNTSYNIYKLILDNVNEWNILLPILNSPSRILDSGVGLFICNSSHISFISKRSGIEMMSITNPNNSRWIDITVTYNQKYLYVLDKTERCIWKYNITLEIPTRELFQILNYQFNKPQSISLLYDNNIEHLIISDAGNNCIIDYCLNSNEYGVFSLDDYSPTQHVIHKQTIFGISHYRPITEELQLLETTSIPKREFLALQRAQRLEIIFNELLLLIKEEHGVEDILIETTECGISFRKIISFVMTYPKPNSELVKVAKKFLTDIKVIIEDTEVTPQYNNKRDKMIKFLSKFEKHQESNQEDNDSNIE